MPVAGADELLELVNVGPIVRAEGLLEVLREPDSALGVDPEVNHCLLTLVMGDVGGEPRTHLIADRPVALPGHVVEIRSVQVAVDDVLTGGPVRGIKSLFHLIVEVLEVSRCSRVVQVGEVDGGALHPPWLVLGSIAADHLRCSGRR